MVSLLAYDVSEVECSNGNTMHDTTEQGRDISGEPTPIISIQNFAKKIVGQSESDSAAQIITSKLRSDNGTDTNRLYNKAFDNREHRQTVCEWVEYSFD